ncbi:hypothetical protein [Sphingomonas sp. CFBP 13720]|uniref:hypothetical protein n=1 Tax=Sphingomonas sp. CFBP 13720 TaxID=2775302 RepID=UPI001783821A|nr:hypothetical protein [Sphingomonas sp. CFBP 13720]MBD8679937.1 hypothetical protein [Sphingomonas sp. CFBP 13720]
MPQVGSLSQRSAREWIVRGLLAVAAVAGGYVGATGSLAYMVRQGDVVTGHALAPNDGRVTAAFARTLTGIDASNAERVRANALARTALRQDPTAVAAVSTLGIAAQLRGDAISARRLLAYANVLSRRDLETQLWAIEDAVGRNDIPGALHHYDIALRTSPGAGELLFPVLAKAGSNADIRTALVATLARKPIWSEAFINRVAAGAADAHEAAMLFGALGKAGVPLPEGAKAATVGALIRAGAVENAWAYYTTIRRGVDRRRSRDPRFTANLVIPSAFDWTPVSEAGGITSIQDGTVSFALPSSVGGMLLQQMQLLTPGIYRVEGHSRGIEQANDALPYWTLKCWHGRELGRVVLPRSTERSGNFAGNFRVPADCPVQTLALVGRASDTVAGLSGELDRVQLAPAL